MKLYSQFRETAGKSRRSSPELSGVKDEKERLKQESVHRDLMEKRAYRLPVVCSLYLGGSCFFTVFISLIVALSGMSSLSSSGRSFVSAS